MTSRNPHDSLRPDTSPPRRGKAGALWPALRSKQYRQYWLFSITSLCSQQIFMIAIAWLIYDITRSAMYLALTGLATAIPGITFSLFGGVMADRLDVRRLLAGTQTFMTLLAFALMGLTASALIEPWQILIVAFLLGCGQAFNNPARQAIYPQLVPREDLSSAVSLNSMVWQGTRILAPAAGGVLIALAGISVTFFVVALGYIPFAMFVRTLSIERQPARGTTLMAAVVEGPRYVIANPLFAALIGLTFFNSFFGVGLTQLFPLIAREILDVGPSGLGIMYSAMGVGALIGLTFAGAFNSFSHPGRLILAFASIYGIVIALLSVATVLWAALVVLFLMGACSQAYMIMVQTVLQMEVPDQLRGRVMGIYTMTYNMGPLGAAQAGSLAAIFNPATAIVVAGVCIVGLAVYLAGANAGLRELKAQPAAV